MLHAINIEKMGNYWHINVNNGGPIESPICDDNRERGGDGKNVFDKICVTEWREENQMMRTKFLGKLFGLLSFRLATGPRSVYAGPRDVHRRWNR